MTITGEQVRAARELLGWPRKMTRLAAQCKAARKILGWSLEDLAQKARLSEFDIARFESGKVDMSFIGTVLLRRALENAGVEFMPGEPSVRLRG
jgi:ribosome-binding protein aMBF1 (putative translation factor)